MDLHTSIVELIDLRSFSNLWYWIMLALVWSSASHWVLGVPYDLVLRAKRKGGQHELDLADMVRINVGRLLYISRTSGLPMLTFSSFAMSSLAVIGFYYRYEFAQAVFLIMFPIGFIGLLSLSTARALETETLDMATLYRRLRRHRIFVQLIGMLSIFITSLWGMYQNFQFSPLN